MFSQALQAGISNKAQTETFRILSISLLTRRPTIRR